MPLMIWSDTYSLNFPIIDEQHQNLFLLVNQLYDSLHGNKGEFIMDKSLDALVAYARVHFIEEEVLMMKSNYPDQEFHQDQHDFFVRRVFELQSDYREGHLNLALPLLDFLTEWLSSHILRADKDIALHIERKKAAKPDPTGRGLLQGNPQ
ncbi:MAG TPA: bacteriohemerythrin [Anaerolineales bacterium]|jgi:hemerythrin-like metal-binding protein